MSHTHTLGAIVITPGSIEVYRRSIEWLAQLDERERVELVVVCNDVHALRWDDALGAPFGRVTIIEAPVAQSAGEFIGAGIRGCHASCVMYVEEHNFPPPGMLGPVLERMGEGVEALGLAMLPANPGAVAWAHLYGQFGPVVAPVRSGPIDRLGGHHAVYLRERLLGFGDRLDALMSDEAVLHELLRMGGVRMEICGEVEVPHVQISRFRDYARLEFLAQRSFAATRVSSLRWGFARRALYVVGAPLVPVLRLARSVGHVVRSGRASLLPAIVPIMFGANVAGAAGELLGLLFGHDRSRLGERTTMELDRYAFVNAEDRAGQRAPRSMA